MSDFLHVRNNLLTISSQGLHGVLYLMLSALGDVDTEPATPNPYKTVLNRLSKYDCDGVKSLKKLIGGRVN